MLKLTLKMLQCVLLGSLLFMGACSVEGVATVPVEPGGEVVGVSPWPGGVWIGGEWGWNGPNHRYDWHGGHWAHAHHGTWQRGNWQQGRHGNTWKRGQWR